MDKNTDLEGVSLLDLGKSLKKALARVNELESRILAVESFQFRKAVEREPYDTALGLVDKVLGIRSIKAIPPLEYALVEARPQINFTGRRILIPRMLSECFSILDVRVGNRSMLVTMDEIPAETFATNANLPDWLFDDKDGVLTIKVEQKASEMSGANLDMVQCDAGGSVFIGVRNTSGTARHFEAAILGTSGHY